MFKNKKYRLALVAVAAAALASFGWAQCTDWKAGPLNGSVSGLDNSVRAMTTWDPDGVGSLPAQLVMGGAFVLTDDGLLVNGITRWDGARWQPFGGGFQPTPGNAVAYVIACAVFPPGSGPNAGRLVAGGIFQSADGSTAVNNIAMWNGSAWQPIGSGLDGPVFALTFWDPDGSGPLPPQLIAGGNFDTADGTTVNNIARWDGTHWKALGGGVADYAYGGAATSVWALTSWDPDGSGPLPAQLIVGGYFSRAGGVDASQIASWDGTSWHALGSGMAGPGALDGATSGVDALMAWDPDGTGPLPARLVAGGFFDTSGGVLTNNIAWWDGTGWHAFGTGMNDEVEALTTLDPDGAGSQPGQLIASGDFTSAGGQTAYSIARWDGSAWQPMGVGLDADVFAVASWTPSGAVLPQLAAGGDFLAIAGAHADFAANWNGSSWQPFRDPEFGAQIFAMANLAGRMVGGGTFTADASNYFSPKNLAGWDGVSISAVGQSGPDATVRALKSYVTGTIVNQTHHLVAGGDFLKVDGVSSPHIAQYALNQTLAFPPAAWTAMGPGLNDTVRAIERFNNLTIAGGLFSATGNNATALSNIGSWNGTSWSALGSGLNSSVLALKVYNGSLYAGGSFTKAGTLNTGGLARWNGSAWSVVVGAFSGVVFCLEVHNGDLVMGGVFPGLSGSPNIARYNSTTNTYSTLGSGGAGDAVEALLSENGSLYAGGAFTTIGGTSAQHFARWNGTSWSALGGGTDSTVFSLAGFHGEVQAGGQFTKVKSGTLTTAGWARFAETGAPWISKYPTLVQDLCARAEAVFSIQVAQDYTDAQYQWRHNSVPLSDGPTAKGSFVAGSRAPVLNVSAIGPADAGTYDCVVSNACGSATTPTATLTACIADLTCDQLVNDADFSLFVIAYDILDCAAPAMAINCPADLNRDGVVDDADFVLFVGAYDDLVCP